MTAGGPWGPLVAWGGLVGGFEAAIGRGAQIAQAEQALLAERSAAGGGGVRSQCRGVSRREHPGQSPIGGPRRLVLATS